MYCKTELWLVQHTQQNTRVGSEQCSPNTNKCSNAPSGRSDLPNKGSATRHQVTYLVPGTWYLVHGTRYLVPSTWYGTGYSVSNIKYLVCPPLRIWPSPPQGDCGHLAIPPLRSKEGVIVIPSRVTLTRGGGVAGGGRSRPSDLTDLAEITIIPTSC
jgi:hypothetical protein